jgi:hypothetical protein
MRLIKIGQTMREYFGKACEQFHVFTVWDWFACLSAFDVYFCGRDDGVL